jgi:hypothetical protein
MLALLAGLLYGLTTLCWLLFWHRAMAAPDLLRRYPLLRAPWLGGALVQLFGALLALQHGASPGREFEAVLFDVLHSRADLVLSASASILVVATVVYGVNQQAPPQPFIRLMSFALVALLGFMLPVVWIPPQHEEWMSLLRHVQTASFNWGLFLMCAGLLILLQDLIEDSATGDNPRR